MLARIFLSLAACLVPVVFSQPAEAAGEKLYGVHWWEYDRPNVGSGTPGGWTVETVLTNSDPWQEGWWYEPLYREVKQTHNAEIITRVDYTWVNGNTTVPAPSIMSAHDWGNKIVSDIIGPLGPYSTRWIIGNEPNILGEGNGWPDNKITPAGYAEIYHAVRQVIKSHRPSDEVLFAPVSPGGIIENVRWMDGEQWLTEAVDATLALPGGAIDGFAIHAYGNPFAGARQAVREFHNDYVSQLDLIDSRGLQHVPVYLTEWNRATSTTGDLAANEQVSADFLRYSLIDVSLWNRTPGRHNIVSTAWFVHEGYGGWEQYSLKWWRAQGNPAGHPGDLWTAMLDSASLPAGMPGTRPMADYNADAVVDESDYNAWRAAFGRTNYPYADGSGNLRVDAADYIVWRKLAAGAGADVPAVPEPATIVYLGPLVLAVLVCARGRNV